MTKHLDSHLKAKQGFASPEGSDTIFLDFQGTTPLDPTVYAAMLPWMRGPWNAHATEHRFGRTAFAAVEASRRSVAAMLGCEMSEIVFTAGASESSNIALRGVTSPGDDLAISAIEHASVGKRPWLCERKGGTCISSQLTRTESWISTHCKSALHLRPALVSIMAVNNEIGTVQPIEEAAALCEQHDAPLHSDLTQAVGRIPLVLKDMPVSYASVSAHKIYGPQGIGALFIRERGCQSEAHRERWCTRKWTSARNTAGSKLRGIRCGLQFGGRSTQGGSQARRESQWNNARNPVGA